MTSIAVHRHYVLKGENNLSSRRNALGGEVQVFVGILTLGYRKRQDQRRLQKRQSLALKILDLWRGVVSEKVVDWISWRYSVRKIESWSECLYSLWMMGWAWGLRTLYHRCKVRSADCNFYTPGVFHRTSIGQLFPFLSQVCLEIGDM